jgi:fructose-1,6-bisphosphatase/inositol monophosphatase family enzyme
MQLRPETTAALTAIEAGQRLSRRRLGADEIQSKGGRELVTGTDLAVEDAIRTSVLAWRPEWTVVGEERGGEDQVGDRPYWLLDPICGTRNFACNLPLYSTNLALVEDGCPTIAIVADGGTGDVYVAQRGDGAWRLTPGDAVRVHASGASGVVSVSPGKARASDRHHHGAEFLRGALVADRWDVRVIGSNIVFPYVATGRLAAYAFFNSVSPVHTTAGCLLVEEAGALVSDFSGQPWTLETRHLLASATPELQSDLVALLTATSPE